MKDPKTFLKHILESIETIEDFMEGVSKKEFMESIKIQDAVLRRLEIIGEAAGNLPERFREEHSEIRWGEIIALRNILIHKYFGVDLELTFRIIKRDLPELKEKILKIL